MADNSSSVGPLKNACIKPEEVDRLRFFLVGVVASGVGVAGALANGALWRLFSWGGGRTRRNGLLATLALLDTAICLLYIALIGSDAWVMHFRLLDLWRLWNQACIPLFYASRFIQLSSSYIVLLATVERFTLISSWKSSPLVLRLTSGRVKAFVTGAVISGAASFYLITFAEYRVWTKDPKETPCKDPMAEIAVVGTALNDRAWKKALDVGKTLIQTFIPFFALSFVNTVIFALMKREAQVRRRDKQARQKMSMSLRGTSVEGEKGGEKDEELQPMMAATLLSKDVFEIRLAEQRSRRKSVRRLRRASWTMVLIASVYLLCNSTSVLIQTLELIPSRPLISDHPNLYVALTDVVSFLFMANSAARLPIHLFCDSAVRTDFRRLFGPKSHV